MDSRCVVPATSQLAVAVVPALPRCTWLMCPTYCASRRFLRWRVTPRVAHLCLCWCAACVCVCIWHAQPASRTSHSVSHHVRGHLHSTPHGAASPATASVWHRHPSFRVCQLTEQRWPPPQRRRHRHTIVSIPRARGFWWRPRWHDTVTPPPQTRLREPASPYGIRVITGGDGVPHANQDHRAAGLRGCHSPWGRCGQAHSDACVTSPCCDAGSPQHVQAVDAERQR